MKNQRIPLQLRASGARGLAPSLVLLATVGHAADAPPTASFDSDRGSAGFRRAALSFARISADECAGPAEISRRVEQVLGRTAFTSTTKADVIIEGWVKRSGEQFHARLSATDSHGRKAGDRELFARSCGELTEQIVLALSLMLEPAEPGPEASERPQAIAAQKVYVDRPVFLPAPVHDHEFRWGIQGGVGFATGVMPSSAAGGVLALQLSHPDLWLVDVRARFFFPRETRDPEGGGGRFQRAGVGVAACPLEARAMGWVDVFACAGMGLDSLSVSGRDLSREHTVNELSAEAAAYGRALLATESGFTTTLALGAALPLVRHSFVFTDSQGRQHELYREPIVTASFEIGMGMWFR